MQSLLKVLLAGALLLATAPAHGEDAPAPTPSPSETPAAKPSPSPSGAAAAHGGTSALVLDESSAQTLLGLPVQTSKGEDMGRVVDVVVERGGALVAAIVDFGGFLGVGTRKIAVDWSILHFPKSGAMNKLVTDLPRDRLQEAPAYKAGEPIVVMGAQPAPASPPAAPAAAAKP